MGATISQMSAVCDVPQAGQVRVIGWACEMGMGAEPFQHGKTTTCNDMIHCRLCDNGCKAGALGCIDVPMIL